MNIVIAAKPILASRINRYPYTSELYSEYVDLSEYDVFFTGRCNLIHRTKLSSLLHVAGATVESSTISTYTSRKRALILFNPTQKPTAKLIISLSRGYPILRPEHAYVFIRERYTPYSISCARELDTLTVAQRSLITSSSLTPST